MESGGIDFANLPFKERAEFDPWGNEFKILSSSIGTKTLITDTAIRLYETTAIYSSGPDGIFDTNDDEQEELWHHFTVY